MVDEQRGNAPVHDDTYSESDHDEENGEQRYHDALLAALERGADGPVSVDDVESWIAWCDNVEIDYTVVELARDGLVDIQWDHESQEPRIRTNELGRQMLKIMDSTTEGTNL